MQKREAKKKRWNDSKMCVAYKKDQIEEKKVGFVRTEKWGAESYTK